MIVGAENSPRIQHHLQIPIHAHKTHTINTQLTPRILRESSSLNLWPPSQFKVQMSFNSNFTLRYFFKQVFHPHFINTFPNLFHVALPNSETCASKRSTNFFLKKEKEI